MKNLQAEFEYCIGRLAALGYQTGPIYRVIINNKAKDWWSRVAKDKDGKFLIQINRRIMYDSVPIDITRTIICEALVRTLPRCFHGGQAANAAMSRIQDAYGYNIQMATTTLTEIPMARPQRKSIVEKVPEDRQLDLHVDDWIWHKKHGKGIVTAISPMGNDLLITILFQNYGSIQLMRRAAALSIRKLEGNPSPAIEKGGESNGPG